jgi:tetratricopeptide (TPR) repeat protein
MGILKRLFYQTKQEKMKDPESYFIREGKLIPITGQRKLLDKAYELFFEKKYQQAESLLLQALNASGDNPIDRHFIYNQLIKLYHKQRDIKKGSLEKCIYYCKEDINNLNKFLDSWKKDYPNDVRPPLCPSVIQLAIIYEKKGEIEEAIKVCRSAIELGLSDDTKGGFEGRLQRLGKKLSGCKK